MNIADQTYADAQMEKAELRMSVYKEHVLDCQGCCEPIDWHTFKIHVWRVAKGDWADAFLLAGKLASGEMTMSQLQNWQPWHISK